MAGPRRPWAPTPRRALQPTLKPVRALRAVDRAPWRPARLGRSRPEADASRDRLAGWLSFAQGAVIPGFYASVFFVSLVGAPLTALHFATLAAPALAVLIFMAQSRTRGNLSSIEVVLSVYFILFALSSVVGVYNDPNLHWPTMFGGLTMELIVALAAMKLGREERTSRTVLYMRGLQIGFLMFVFVLFTKGGVGANRLKQTSFITFAEGIDRNGVMVLSLLALAASFTLLLTRRLDWLSLASATVAVYLIAFSASKGAWVSGGAMALLFFALSIMRGWWGRVLGAVLGGAAAAPIIIPRLQTYLNFYLHRTDSQSLSGRTDLWAFALNRIQERNGYWLGFGFNSGAGAAPKANYVFHLHNEFVNSYYSGGVFGVFVVFSLFLLYLGLSSSETWRQVRVADKAHSPAPDSLFCSMIGVFVLTRLLTDVSLSSSIDTLPVFLFGCGLIAGRLREQGGGVRRGWRRRNQALSASSRGPAWRRGAVGVAQPSGGS